MTNTVSKTVSDETLNCIIQIESAGRLTVKAPTSSALGLGQFLDATWMGVVKKHRPDLLEGRSKPQVLALRTDPQIAVELLARFTEDNQHAIGMNCSGGDLYLAHFLGVADAKDLFSAHPDTQVSQLVTPAVINANKTIMLGKTAGQVRAWAAKRMYQSGGHDWVAKYYTPPAAAQAPADEPTAEEIPDPQDAPATPLPEPTAVVPVDAAPEVQDRQIQESAARDAEPGPSWLKRKWRSLTGTLSGFLGFGGLAAFDWRIVAAISAVVFAFAIFIILFMGPGDVRAWVRKQVS